MIKIIIAVVAIVTVIGIGYFSYSSPSHNQPKQYQQDQPQQPQDSQQESLGAYGFKTPFYNKNGISLQHYWPYEGSFSAEETEILLFNDSSTSVQVKSYDLTYIVEDKVYPPKSGTWEKFPTKTSWDRIEYINISPQYYQDQPLDLARGEKGKLHWHIQFGSKPLDGKQTITVKLTLIKGGQTINIDEQFTKPSGTVVSKEDH